MKEYIEKLPKTTIATILGALIVYLSSKGYIGDNEATFFSSVLVALGLSVNLISGKFNGK